MITEKKGLGTIYPTFSFKLYSQPLGTHIDVEEYRIYSKNKSDSVFIRNPIHELNGFTTDEYVYTFNYFIKRTLEDTLITTEYKNRLLSFAKYAVPNKEQYKIVAEKYSVVNLAEHISSYDTLTIISF
jgi:hypothetical protein